MSNTFLSHGKHPTGSLSLKYQLHHKDGIWFINPVILLYFFLILLTLFFLSSSANFSLVPQSTVVGFRFVILIFAIYLIHLEMCEIYAHNRSQMGSNIFTSLRIFKLIRSRYNYGMSIENLDAVRFKTI